MGIFTEGTVSKAVWEWLYGEKMGGMEKLEEEDSQGLTYSSDPQIRAELNGKTGCKQGLKGMFSQGTLWDKEA